jgi:hypothetical protein
MGVHSSRSLLVDLPSASIDALAPQVQRQWAQKTVHIRSSEHVQKTLMMGVRLTSSGWNSASMLLATSQISVAGFATPVGAAACLRRSARVDSKFMRPRTESSTRFWFPSAAMSAAAAASAFRAFQYIVSVHSRRRWNAGHTAARAVLAARSAARALSERAFCRGAHRQIAHTQ